MDVLSSTLTTFDDINIKCQTHDIPSIGVCGDYFCKERRFLCMKCIKDIDSCINSQKHELISLSELLYRFFLKQETKAIDLVEINTMMESLKQIDRMEITKNLSDFTKNCQFGIEKVTDDFIFNLKEAIEGAKNSNSKNLVSVGEILTKQPSDYEGIVNLEVPAVLQTNNIEAVKKFLANQNVKLYEKESLFRFLKAVHNFEKISKLVDYFDELSYIEKLTNNYFDNLEKNITLQVDELESQVNKKIQELEDTVIPSNKEGVVVIKHSLVKFVTNPNDLIFKLDITDQAHKANSIDNVFCAFKTIKGDHFVAWGTPTFNVIVYDLKTETIFKTYVAHTSTIFSCRHYLDKINKQDLLITSSYDRSVKVWNITNNFVNLLTIATAHNGYYIYSVCILSDEVEHKNYVITSAPNEYSKIWDFSGKFIREFGVSNESTYFINTWYNVKQKKYYIINANSVDVKVYDFKTGLLFKAYKITPNTWHMSAMINEVDNVTQLIESDGNGNVRIWDFYQGTLLKTIASSGINLRGICLWNDQYLFAAGSDYNVKLYDLKAGAYLKKYDGHTSTCCAVEKIVHPKYGECLISHALDGKLKLWINKNLKQ
jgi:hypothetical protein